MKIPQSKSDGIIIATLGLIITFFTTVVLKSYLTSYIGLYFEEDLVDNVIYALFLTPAKLILDNFGISLI